VSAHSSTRCSGHVGGSATRLGSWSAFNTRRRLTVDGHEEMFAVNHLAHDLLTRLLLEHVSTVALHPGNIASGLGAHSASLTRLAP